MSFAYDSTGIKIKSNDPIPDGKYVLRIVSAEEGTSQKGDYMVKVDFEVAEGKYIGRPISHYYVVFFRDKESKGAGMAIHFLNCIQQPYEGEFIVEPSAWLGSQVLATVYQKPSNKTGKKYPAVRFLDPCVHNYTLQPPVATHSEEEVPF